MARVRIVSNKVVLAGGVTRLEGEELVGPEVSLKALVRAGSAEWVESGPGAADDASDPEAAPIMYAFASAAASELAEAEGFGPADFEGVEPSGATGYTKADVEAVLRRREEE